MVSFVHMREEHTCLPVETMQRLGVRPITRRPLVDDGIIGPNTRAALYLDPCDLDTSVRTVEEAVADVLTPGGLGEVGGNNRGPFVAKLFRKVYEVGKTYWPWCAVYASDVLERVHGSDAPRSGSARSLGKAIRKEVGECDPMLVRPGCWAIWQRSFSHWKGHIGIVVHVTKEYVWVVEGNGKARKGKVRVYCYPRNAPDRGKGNALLFYTNPM